VPPDSIPHVLNVGNAAPGSLADFWKSSNRPRHERNQLKPWLQSSDEAHSGSVSAHGHACYGILLDSNTSATRPAKNDLYSTETRVHIKRGAS